jgi:hypothetical protein
MKQYEFKAVAELDRVLVAMAGGAKDVEITVPPAIEMDNAEAEEFMSHGNPELWTADLDDSVARHLLLELKDGKQDSTKIAGLVIKRWTQGGMPIRWLLDQVPRVEVPSDAVLPVIDGDLDFLNCFSEMRRLTSDQFRHIREMRVMRARGHGPGTPKYDKRVQRTRDDPLRIAALRQRLERSLDVMGR